LDAIFTPGVYDPIDGHGVLSPMDETPKFVDFAIDKTDTDQE